MALPLSKMAATTSARSPRSFLRRLRRPPSKMAVSPGEGRGRAGPGAGRASAPPTPARGPRPAGGPQAGRAAPGALPAPRRDSAPRGGGRDGREAAPAAPAPAPLPRRAPALREPPPAGGDWGGGAGAAGGPAGPAGPLGGPCVLGGPGPRGSPGPPRPGLAAGGGAAPRPRSRGLRCRSPWPSPHPGRRRWEKRQSCCGAGRASAGPRRAAMSRPPARPGCRWRGLGRRAAGGRAGVAGRGAGIELGRFRQLRPGGGGAGQWWAAAGAEACRSWPAGVCGPAPWAVLIYCNLQREVRNAVKN